MITRKIALSLATLATIPAFGIGTANAAETTTATTNAARHPFAHNGSMGHPFLNKADRPVAIGKVSAINGTTLTLTDLKGTVYTIDASAAALTKGPRPTDTTTVAPKLADIKQDNLIAVVGTVNGTVITAKTLLLGGGLKRPIGNLGHETGISNKMTFAPGSRPTGHMQRNRGIAGTITAINGNTLTLTARNNTTYTVEVSTAKIARFATPGTAPAMIAASALATGETVVIHGTVSGTAITAQTVVSGLPERMERPASQNIQE